jgi:hypothetical protein
MNRISCRILCQALLLTTLFGLGHAAASAEPEAVSRIAVVFVEPEKFTDARRADFKPNSDAILDAIAKFMQEMGEEILPPDMNLDIRVTDIDLAGNFEPGRGPQSDQVRSQINFIYRGSSSNSASSAPVVKLFRAANGS